MVKENNLEQGNISKNGRRTPEDTKLEKILERNKKVPIWKEDVIEPTPSRYPSCWWTEERIGRRTRYWASVDDIKINDKFIFSDNNPHRELKSLAKAALYRYDNSWNKWLKASHVDPGVYLKKKCWKDIADLIIEGLIIYYNKREPISHKYLSRNYHGLYRVIINIFGTYKEYVEVLGFDYNEIKQRGFLLDGSELIKEVKKLNKSMNPTKVRNHDKIEIRRVYNSVAKKIKGAWNEAAKIANNLPKIETIVNELVDEGSFSLNGSTIFFSNYAQNNKGIYELCSDIEKKFYIEAPVKKVHELLDKGLWRKYGFNKPNFALLNFIDNSNNQELVHVTSVIQMIHNILNLDGKKLNFVYMTEDLTMAKCLKPNSEGFIDKKNVYTFLDRLNTIEALAPTIITKYTSLRNS